MNAPDVRPPGEPTVTVVIPTFNRADQLSAAVSSALDQSHPPLEVLVCDDASTDSSATVVAAIGDRRVRWLPTAVNSGSPAQPRNRGVAAATGQWVAFLDSDDTWLPGHLASVLTTAANAGAPLACGNAWLVEAGQSAGRRYLRRPPGVLPRTRLLWDNAVITSSVIVRTDVLRQAGPFPTGYGFGIYEDYAVWLRLSLVTPFPVAAEPTVRYQRATPGAASGQVVAYPSLLANAAEHRDWCRIHARPSAARAVWRIRARAECGRMVRALRRVGQ